MGRNIDGDWSRRSPFKPKLRPQEVRDRVRACVHSQSTGSGLAWLLLKREKGGKGREGSDGGIGWMADEASHFCFY